MPSIVTRPSSTSYRRGIRYVVVVLPAPDGPTSATSSPGCASKRCRRGRTAARGSSTRPPSTTSNARARPRCPAARRLHDRFDERPAFASRSTAAAAHRRPATRRRAPAGSGTTRPRAPPRPRTVVGLERHGVRRVDDLRVEVEVLEDPVEQRERALDLDLDVEQLAEREEQPALERRERDDVAGGRRVRVAVGRQVPASQYTNAGMIEKIVPMIMKNQRPTIAWRIWSRASSG